jgi:hypothetical protein
MTEMVDRVSRNCFPRFVQQCLRRCLLCRPVDEVQGCQMVCFQTKTPNLGKFYLEGLRLDNVYIFYGHLEYFMEIWDILWPFGIFCIHLVHFFRFWYHVQRKIWQPWWGLYDAAREPRKQGLISGAKNTFCFFFAGIDINANRSFVCLKI